MSVSVNDLDANTQTNNYSSWYEENYYNYNYTLYKTIINKPYFTLNLDKS